MLKRLTLKNFKSFQDATIEFDRFSVLVGANASGKSNIVEALRFLNGIGRGYSASETIVGQSMRHMMENFSGLQTRKNSRGDLGDRIRGGSKGITFQKSDSFEIKSAFSTEIGSDPDLVQQIVFNYKINIKISSENNFPSTTSECFFIDKSCFPIHGYSYHKEGLVYETAKPTVKPGELTENMIGERRFNIFMSDDRVKAREKTISQDILGLASVFGEYWWKNESLKSEESSHFPELAPILTARAPLLMAGISAIDFSPEVMREPSVPGQSVLGDRGENLSSVLQSICHDSQQKERLLSWLQELTPMDAVDIEFREDLSGKILLELVEGNGQRTLAYSASDGTLRFLGLLAALLNPRNASSPHLYIFEELENGIHPTRLYLVMQLIAEEITRNPNLQVIATTHSPLLLHFLDQNYWDGASLIYRLPGQPDSKVAKIMDIPNARKIVEEQDFARLHESGWLENAMYFLADDEE
ncbi:MAG: AAA family ATPase [Cyanothece sp. SIO2G6]|nr:AAA family ATPase [Cyanothece sp. SIO2G6]